MLEIPFDVFVNVAKMYTKGNKIKYLRLYEKTYIKISF